MLRATLVLFMNARCRSTRHSRPICTNALIIFAFVACSVAYGQEVRGTISGNVTDPQGALIGGAKVAVKNLDTNVVYPATTNDSGLYVLPLLPSGNYSITVSHEGFTSATEPRLQLSANQRLEQDFHLQIGSISQQVVVTAEAPPIRTPNPPLTNKSSVNNWFRALPSKVVIPSFFRRSPPASTLPAPIAPTPSGLSTTAAWTPCKSMAASDSGISSP